MKRLACGSTWICALLLAAPAPAAAAEASTVLLRAGSFGSAAARPIRHRAPYDYHRQAPYGFLTLGGGVFEPVHQPGNGFYGVITAGTEVGKALDLGLQFSWYHRGSEGEQFVGSYVGPGGNVIQQSIQTQSVNTDLLPLMGIARLKFPITTVLQPYVGGGAGFEWLFIEGVDGAGYQFTNDYGGFGAQAMAGVNLAASPTVALYGEAVYNFSTVDADFYDPFYGVVVHESVNYDGWAYHGGLRFRF